MFAKHHQKIVTGFLKHKRKHNYYYSTVNSHEKNIRPFAEIPGPKMYPIVGNLFDLKEFGGDFDILDYDSFLKQLQSKYGDIVKFVTPFAKMVHVFNPDLVKQVFLSEGNSPNRPEPLPWKFYLEMKGIKKGVLISQDEQWRKLRTVSNPIVARPSTVSLFLPQYNTVVNTVIELINSKFKNGNNTVVIQAFEKTLQLAALELISVAAFDKRLECIDERKRTAEIETFVKSVDELFASGGELGFSIPIWKYYRTKQWKRFEEAADVVFAAAKNHVINANMELSKKNDKYKQDILSKSILEQYLIVKDKYNLTLDDIIAVVGDFLIAGVDTTSTVLHYILYELGRHPDLQDRVYDEIKANIRANDDVKADAVEQLHFMKAVLKEALRLHTPTPGNARILKEDLVLENFLIPSGVMLAMSTPYITTSSRFFKNPLEFNPSRWLKNDQHYESIHPYASLPFGFGTRMCIGRRLVEQEIYVYLVKIIQNYRIEYIGETFKYRVKIVRSPDKPLDLKFTKRTRIESSR